MQWPEGKKFAFTIVDDTDHATISNIKPIYDLLKQLNMKTTKTVWSFPSRDHFTGMSLENEDYTSYMKELQKQGFELALHNVGSGRFTREEIFQGWERFHQCFSFYPRIHINHAHNLDNMYWGYDRFTPILKWALKLIYRSKRSFFGHDPNSKYFWGDLCKSRVQYIRNHTFQGINTLRHDEKMPYISQDKSLYSNYWFSSSDGHTEEEFTNLISPSHVDQLEKEQGCCIVYTHFACGFVNQFGEISPKFKERIHYLSQKSGWFVPLGTLLDYLKSQREDCDVPVSADYLHRLDARWMLDRIIKKIKYHR